MKAWTALAALAVLASGARAEAQQTPARAGVCVEITAQIEAAEKRLSYAVAAGEAAERAAALAEITANLGDLVGNHCPGYPRAIIPNRYLAAALACRADDQARLQAARRGEAGPAPASVCNRDQWTPGA